MKSSELKYRDKNPRKISPESLEDLKKSLKEDPDFLEERPICINQTKEWLIVYAWNQRLRGLIAIWYEEIPDNRVKIRKNLSKEIMEKRAFKDNSEYGEYDYDILESNFDSDYLKSLAEDLPDWELKLSNDKTFSNKEIDPDQLYGNKNTIVCPKCKFEFVKESE